MTTYQITHGRVTWLNIVQPTSADVEALRQAYPLIHPLNLEDLMSPLERPKIDEDDSYLFVVMHFPLWDPRLRLSRAAEVDLIVGRGYIITIHDGTLKPLQSLFQQCESQPDFRERLMGRGSSHVFYVIIDQLVDYVFPILRKLDANIRRIEEDIFTSDARVVIREIALLRRDAIALRRIIRQQVPIVEQLEHIEHPIILEEQEEYFGDIVDHLYKARDIIDEDFEVIGSLSDTADTLVSHRINEVMRILTVISVIMLPLTLISSIYGMNIGLPLEEHPNAFIIVSVVMMLVVVLMLAYFRRRNWL